jgi:hypothetical protein
VNLWCAIAQAGLGGGHEQQTLRAPLSLRHGWVGPSFLRSA